MDVASAPEPALRAGEGSDRLAQRVRRVVATGSSHGIAVPGGDVAAAIRLPCDAGIAGDPRDEPAQLEPQADRRGHMPAGGCQALGLAMAIFLGGHACTAAAAGAILMLCKKARIVDPAARVIARLRRVCQAVNKAVPYAALCLLMISSHQGSAVDNPTLFAPEPALRAGEGSDRLAQRVRRVVATGSSHGIAVPGGDVAAAIRLPCDADIAHNPGDEPAQLEPQADRRGIGILHSLSWPPPR